MNQPSPLNREEIRRLIGEERLITGYIDIEKQLQPAGFDLTLAEVYEFLDAGSVDFTNEERRLPEMRPLKPDGEGWYRLPRGCYLIVYNEAVRIPLDIVAIARPRSTLLRCGASIGTAVWDPGYEGRSSSLLMVHNPHGIRLKRNARVVQLLFFRIRRVEEGYRGAYQRERLGG
ncbi:MAG TPA: deoxyuridine 5'-triphosphate nucleotidohydrolase [Candidatus Bathyarchaeota archaeon]|nr:deoxyuridine 5'-triphosphate nucleotidohydrolase [Candidatus Bathyarchaeota archaeon]